jgi:hypothetical protein
MKKYGIIFFQLSVIIMLFACTAASRPIWIDKDKAAFAWDPVTTTMDDQISYSVYICDSEAKDKEANKVQLEKCDTNNDGKGIKNPPIACVLKFAETSCIVKFNASGIFVIGVQAVDKEKGYSPIAWSDNKLYTSKNPFFIGVSER